jgi:acyl-homoserine lactone acylase PvdQ
MDADRIWRRIRRGMRLVASCGVCAAAVVAPARAAPAPAPEPYGTNDAGGFRNVLPAGENGFDNAKQVAEFEASKTYPPHFADQLPLYANLLYASPALTHEQIGSFFKDATFGVKEGEVATSESPRSDVTIVRDSAYGVPHIYGSTRNGVMFGAGFAAAQDRLFLMDAIRHLARAELSSFAGGAASNRAMDREQWLAAPYTEADLQWQIENLPKTYGAAGAQVIEDAKELVAGINAYIAEAKLDPNKMPAEYAGVGRVPEEWKLTDVIAETSLISGLFGKGGGAEVRSALALEAFEKKFGKKSGRYAWRDFREQNDPEAPTTIAKAFPYETGSPFARAGLAMPDPGSVSFLSDGEELKASSPAGSQRASGTASQPAAGGSGAGTIPRDGALGSLLAGARFGGHESNWELVNAAHSTNGHSIAVMGPQIGYYTPEVLMEEDLHGPGIDARGATGPGVNTYVFLGHGRDYAWSITSAEADNVDTFAEVLCSDEFHYLYKGQCVPMEKLEHTNTWTPNASDQTPPGSEKLTIYRTVHGIVYARGTVNKGVRVAFASARTTYFHEYDSEIGFSELNEPGFITSPQQFEQATAQINYGFNFAYVDANHIAYDLAGWYPSRAPKTSPAFPILGTGEYDWQGFEPKQHTESVLAPSAHPNAIDPPFLISWNNKQAPRFAAGDDRYSYGSVYRMQLIRNFIEGDLSGGKKIGLEQLISAMDEAATQDVRIVELWPIIKKLLGTPANAAVQDAVATLDGWYAAGGHRRDLTNKDIAAPGTYQHNEAVTLMDAWWPKLLEAEFKPALGSEAVKALKTMLGFGAPYPGSEPAPPDFSDGWYGYVSKDLRDLLAANGEGTTPKAAYSRIYCGEGSLEACRTALQTSLGEALSVTPAQIYGHGECAENAQASCFDENRWVSASALKLPPFPFQNRPTFQQAIELTRTLPR